MRYFEEAAKIDQALTRMGLRKTKRLSLNDKKKVMDVARSFMGDRYPIHITEGANATWQVVVKGYPIYDQSYDSNQNAKNNIVRFPR